MKINDIPVGVGYNWLNETKRISAMLSGLIKALN